MPRILNVALVFLMLLAGAALADDIFVRLTTDSGEIVLRMWPDLAPNHVANFTHLCESGFYDGVSFHRVIPGFMIQSGDPNSKDDDTSDDGQGGPLWSDVLAGDELEQVLRTQAMLYEKGYAGFGAEALLKAEINDASHVRGTLSMARRPDPDSAGSQFFISVADTRHLDGKYTIFGRVVSGLDVVDAIVSVERNRQDIPLQTIRITKAEVIDGAAGLTDTEREALAGETTTVGAE